METIEKLHGKHVAAGRHASRHIGLPDDRPSHGGRHVRPAIPEHPPTINYDSTAKVRAPQGPMNTSTEAKHALKDSWGLVGTLYPLAQASPLPYPPLPGTMDNPGNTGPLAVVSPTTPISIPQVTLKPVRRPRLGATRSIGVAMATGSLLLIGSGGTAVQQREVEDLSSGETPVVGAEPIITADAAATVTPPRVEVDTEAAPPPPPPPPPVVVEAPPVVVPEQQAAPVPPPAPAPAPVADLSKAQRILSAAMAQLGVYQDCTMLVTNSLAAVGIYFHDWPVGYFSLGYTVPASEAIPGDLIYYANGGAGVAHIAVYAGNGMAVHGGFNGNETRLWTAYVGSGPVFIRVA